MLNLTLTIGGNTLEMSGEDLSVDEAFPVLTDWLAALPQTVSPQWTARVTHSLDLLLTRSGADAAQRGILMTTIADIHAQADKALAAIAAESDKDDAIIALVTANTAQISSLREQLAQAIADNDPTALQAVLDQLTAAETSALANADKVTAAVNLNTPPVVVVPPAVDPDAPVA